MSKVEQIRGLLDDLTLRPPDDPDGLMWFKPDRGSPNYFRLVPMEDDLPDHLYFDVWVETDLSTDKAGINHFSMEAVLFSGPGSYRMEERELASLSFGYNEVSTQQTILNNWEPAYKKRARDAIADFAEQAEYDLRDEMERATEA